MERKIRNAVNQLYRFLLLNSCFFLANLLFLFCTVTLRPVVYTVPFYLAGGLLLGPGLAALMKCLTAERRELSLFSCYFRSWKNSWKTASKYTLLLEIGLLVLYVDMRFFSQFPFSTWVNPLLAGISLFLVMVYSQALFDYSTVGQDYLASLNGIVSLFQKVFANWLLGLVNALILLTFILLLIVQPIIGFFLLPSAVVWLIYKNQLRCAQLKLEKDK